MQYRIPTRLILFVMFGTGNVQLLAFADGTYPYSEGCKTEEAAYLKAVRSRDKKSGIGYVLGLLASCIHPAFGIPVGFIASSPASFADMDAGNAYREWQYCLQYWNGREEREQEQIQETKRQAALESAYRIAWKKRLNAFETRKVAIKNEYLRKKAMIMNEGYLPSIVNEELRTLKQSYLQEIDAIRFKYDILAARKWSKHTAQYYNSKYWLENNQEHAVAVAELSQKNRELERTLQRKKLRAFAQIYWGFDYEGEQRVESTPENKKKLKDLLDPLYVIQSHPPERYAPAYPTEELDRQIKDVVRNARQWLLERGGIQDISLPEHLADLAIPTQSPFTDPEYLKAEGLAEGLDEEIYDEDEWLPLVSIQRIRENVWD